MMPDTHRSIFEQCTALLHAPDEYRRLDMEALVRVMGFGHVLALAELNAVPAQTLSFYFLHGDLPGHAKTRLIKGLRSSEELRRRYAAIICVLPHGPRHQIIAQIEMGFDEAVFLNDPVSESARTLGSQINCELLYIEAPKYFGPDRRRLERISRDDSRRALGGTMHHRIQVVRDPVRGIRVTYER